MEKDSRKVKRGVFYLLHKYNVSNVLYLETITNSVT